MEVSCHCGNVRITFHEAPKEVGECNCSICRRYAALWAYYSPQQVDVIDQKGTAAFYCWGDEEVEFYRCNECGCITHYKTTPKCDEEIVAVNMRMAELSILAAIPVRKINGAAY